MKPNKLLEKYSAALNKLDIDKELYIQIHQALYRIFALDNPEWFVLHGSSISVDGKGIVFGDDGVSIGKTSKSLHAYNQLNEAGIDTRYVVDEFTLYRNGYIYPNRNFLIHDRDNNDYLKLDKYEINPVKLHAIVCPKVGDSISFSRLGNDDAALARKCTAFAHLVKLQNPECDRSSLFEEDRVEVKDIRAYMKNYPDFDNVPVYILQTVDKDTDLLPFLNEILMEKTIKQHISCGGVLFNEDSTKVYLIYKNARDEWLLPKGHVEEGEDHVRTAIREVIEETGYQNVEILDTKPVMETSYEYEVESDPKFRHEKQVIYFAMRILDKEHGESQERIDEGLSGAWFDVNKAIQIVEHDDQKEAIRQAKRA